MTLETCRLCGSTDVCVDFGDGHKSRLLYYRCPQCRLVNYDLDQGLDQTQYTDRYVGPTEPNHKPNRDGAQG